MKLLLATRSAGKLAELRRVLAGSGVDLVGLADIGLEETADEAELESHSEFAENALAKARHFFERTGLPTLADDSGLVVEALDGEPGVRSKRYAPADWQREHGVDRANNLCLLQALEDVPDDRRNAHFHCSMALVLGDGSSRVFEGRVDGLILRQPRGTGGFGYDPLFLLPEHGRTTAELQPEEKNAVSHRGRAARKVRDWLVEHLGDETLEAADQ